MDKTALLIIDAQQEHFAPIGKGPGGAVIPHDQVHRTHPGSLNGCLAEVKRTAEVIGVGIGA